MPEASAPAVTLLSPEEARHAAADPRVLALVSFGGEPTVGDGTSPWLGTGLEALEGPAGPVQCWRAEAPVSGECRGRFSVRLAPGLAFVATVFPDEADPLAAAAGAYRELLALARDLDRPHLLRVWQYLPRVTEPWADENRYKRFCAGRRLAFEAAGLRDAALPAACLLGNGGDVILLYALLGDTPGVQLENPRQVSAFHYPEAYGRVPPAFSRGLVRHWANGAVHLYISGTASVVGHASTHEDTLAQLEETLKNVEALLAAGQVHGIRSDAGLAAVRPLTVYLRRPADLQAVKAALATRMPAGHPVVYLRADVCRPELLVEIEGIAVSR